VREAKERAMDALVTLAIVAASGGLVVVAGLALYRLWCAVMQGDRPVLMHRMLARQGLSLAGVVDPDGLARAGAAARRCIACSSQDSCLAWLQRDGSTGYERFCPNADFIARLKAEGRLGG
jgi:hypothetical protein